MLWSLFTIMAVSFQTFRNLEQKALSKKINDLTTCWSRYILPFPFTIVAIFYSVSFISKSFLTYCIITAIGQIIGNLCLLQAFRKNFSIGIAFYKTEILQAAILGFIFFGEDISLSGIIAIIITTIGVLLMSGSFNQGIKKFFLSLNNKAAIFGLLCGFFLSVSAFSLKFATQELLNMGHPLLKSVILVLLWTIFLQNITFILVTSLKKSLVKDLKSLVVAENKYAFIRTSIFSFCGSYCWFLAYALGKVVYVKAVGQLELIIAIFISHFILKEKLSLTESMGITLTALGILGLIFSRKIN